MAKVLFKSYNQNDFLLFPPTFGEMVPQNHPVRIVNSIIDNIDVSEIEATYKGGGTTSYHPRMMLKVWVYAYLSNIYSGRELESKMQESVYFMWLSGNQHPDFRTLNLFRSQRLGEGRFDSLFVQIVRLLQAEGLISLEVQYIDGTKIESSANRYTFVWKGSTEKNQAKLDAKVKAVLQSANEVLKEEINVAESENIMTGEQIRESTDRLLSKMDEMGMSNKRLKKSLHKVRTEMADKMEEYEHKMKTLGERNSYSKTDPDATFMRMKEDAMMNGQTKPGYNAQISTENQFITNFGLYQKPADQGTLEPFLESFKEKYGEQSKEVVADSGYGSEQNYEYLENEGVEAYVKYNMFHAEDKRKNKNNPFLPQNMFFNEREDFYVCPMGQHLDFIGYRKTVSDRGYVSKISVYRARNCTACPLRCQCYKGKSDRRSIEINHKNNQYRKEAKERLTSEKGLYHRSHRPIEPEAVFGQIKYDHMFKRFRMKSLPKVYIEFGMVALAHNIRKYYAVKRKRQINSQIMPLYKQEIALKTQKLAA